MTDGVTFDVGFFKAVEVDDLLAGFNPCRLADGVKAAVALDFLHFDFKGVEFKHCCRVF